MESIRHFDAPFWALLITGTLTSLCVSLLGTAITAS